MFRGISPFCLQPNTLGVFHSQQHFSKRNQSGNSTYHNLLQLLLIFNLSFSFDSRRQSFTDNESFMGYGMERWKATQCRMIMQSQNRLCHWAGSLLLGMGRPNHSGKISDSRFSAYGRGQGQLKLNL